MKGGVRVGVARVAVMSSFLHEVVVEMFRDRPGLAAELLTGLFGVSVPCSIRLGCHRLIVSPWLIAAGSSAI